MSHPEQQPDGQQPVFTPGAAPVPANDVVTGAEAATTEYVPAAAPMSTPIDTASFPAVPASTSDSAPAYATPAYAAPVSAPGYGAPVSAPGYGAPAYPVAQPGYPVATPVAEKRGKGGIITLSIVSFLLLVSTFGVTTLYFVEKSDHKATKDTVAQQTTTLAANKLSLEDLQKKIDAKTAEISKLTTDATSAKEDIEELTKAKSALVGCFKAIEAYAGARNATNAAKVNKACKAADPYII